MKKLGKLLALVLSVSLLAMAFAGCSGNEDNSGGLQQGPTPQKVYKVGILQFAEHPSLDNCREGFIKGMTEAGFIEGENVTYEYENAGGEPGVANQLAGSMASKGYDLVCAVATPAAQAAYNACQPKNIPVVYVAVADPEAAQLTNTDGGNKLVTGTSDLLPVESQLKMIRAFLPEVQNIGILYSLSEVNSESQVKMFEEAAKGLGLTIVPMGVTAGSEVPMAMDSLLPKVDCLNNITDNTVVSALPTVLDKADAAKKPVFGSEIEQVKNGCLAADGIEYVSLGAVSGEMAARVLNGEDITKIPFYTVSESSPVVNQKVMEFFGMTLPESMTSAQIIE